MYLEIFFFFFQAEDGIRDIGVTGVQTCALPIFFNIFVTIFQSFNSCILCCCRSTHYCILMYLFHSIYKYFISTNITHSPSSHRSEEHTSELQSRQYLVCRLLLEKKNKTWLQEERAGV